MRLPALRGLAALTLLSAPAAAQSSPVASRALWLSYFGDHPLGARTALLVDVQARGEGMNGGWRQYLVRPGLSYSLRQALRVSAGYGFLRTAVPASTTDEHRAWQMVQVAHGAGPLSLTHRVRIEERWERTSSLVAGGTVAARQSERARYWVRAATRPRERGLGARLQLFASEELLAPFGGDAGRLAVDQNRASAGVALPLGPRLRMELGYLNQAAVQGSRDLAVRRHALTVSLYSSQPFGQ